MTQRREGYAPFSLTRKAGVQSATVNGTIDVIQEIRPVLSTGFIDEKGDWKGTKSSDEVFKAFDTHVGIPNTGEILTPQAISDTIWPLDMTGFKDLFIAIKPTRGGGYLLEAVMGPNDLSFANLNPVNPAVNLRYQNEAYDGGSPAFADVCNDTETCTVNVWNIFYIPMRARNQKLLQFKITNNSGGESDIETAFMRLV